MEIFQNKKPFSGLFVCEVNSSINATATALTVAVDWLGPAWP
jgi:hypothetical protein